MKRFMAIFTVFILAMSVFVSAADIMVRPVTPVLISKTQTTATVQLTNGYIDADSIAVYLASDTTLVAGSVADGSGLQSYNVTIPNLTAGTDYSWKAGVDSVGTFLYSVGSLDFTTLFRDDEAMYSPILDRTETIMHDANSPITATVDSITISTETGSDSTAVYRLVENTSIVFEVTGETDSTVVDVRIYTGRYDETTGIFYGAYAAADTLAIIAVGFYKIDVTGEGADFTLIAEGTTDNGTTPGTVLKNIYAIRPR